MNGVRFSLVSAWHLENVDIQLNSKHQVCETWRERKCDLSYKEKSEMMWTLDGTSFDVGGISMQFAICTGDVQVYQWYLKAKQSTETTDWKAK